MRIAIFFIMFAFIFGFLAGIFSYEKLIKEEILTEDERKKWKKWLLIIGIISVSLFVIFCIMDAYVFTVPHYKPFYYDGPLPDSKIRYAMNMFGGVNHA